MIESLSLAALFTYASQHVMHPTVQVAVELEDGPAKCVVQAFVTSARGDQTMHQLARY